MNPYLRLWAMALAAAILFVFGRPAHADHVDAPSAVTRAEAEATRPASWHAMPPRDEAGPARIGLVFDAKPGASNGLRGLQWRMQLDAHSTLALRLRSRQVSVQWRVQF